MLENIKEYKVLNFKNQKCNLLLNSKNEFICEILFLFVKSNYIISSNMDLQNTQIVTCCPNSIMNFFPKNKSS